MPYDILIATPCYGNSVTTGYLNSIIKVIAMYITHPTIRIHIQTLGNESLITRARNTLVAQFLAGSYSHLLFIDADIEFPPQLIERLVSSDKEIACAVYPRKRIAWEKLPSLDVKTMSTDEVQGRLLDYNVHLMVPGRTPHKDDQFGVIDPTGFMQVARAATGFMLIKRGVFDKLRRAYPKLKYVSDDVSERAIADHLWTFFDCGVDERGAYMSEDYAFCDKWSKINGKIYVDVLTGLTHIGIHAFKGCGITGSSI